MYSYLITVIKTITVKTASTHDHNGFNTNQPCIKYKQLPAVGHTQLSIRISVKL